MFIPYDRPKRKGIEEAKKSLSDLMLAKRLSGSALVVQVFDK